MKRTLFFAILAAVIAPLPAAAQLNPEAAPPPEQGTPTFKYEGFVGVAYTRLRQVPESYSGLLGGKVTLSRNWGKYFELMATGDEYKMGTGHSELPSPGHPTITSFLVGPGLHATLYGNLSGQVFAELGGEHTGGESMTPKISFAGGFGGGLAYSLSRRWAVQLMGDRVAASFSLPNNTPELAYSTHKTWNVRGTFGVVYRF